MADETEKQQSSASTDESPGDDEHERPTNAPAFDPVAFAREALPGDLRPARPPMATLHDPTETEEARVRSMAEAPPKPKKPTPKGILSLANARIPSNLPPRVPAPPPPQRPQRKETISGLNALDREWADLEVATRPPPAGESPDDEMPTRPPPPGEMERLEALSRAERDDGPPTVQQPPSEATRARARRDASLAPASRKEKAPPSVREMNDRVALGDYTGALETAEQLLAEDPTNAAAIECAESCRNVLRQMYTARVGPLDRVPIVMVPRDQLRWLSIDHRAGFVLSLVDGVSSLEMILDVSGMPELDALRILAELAQQRIISFR